ncbi:Uncharacterized protein OS=Planctomyces brasiliensis (strain ATCC 49424 / DSM 5305 / JCM 21570 / NBRC 103401 / IFAM 1448) GN=Plabr_3771 PE=4 SV=1 [Gemmataceae bacterium]|nr:Uncharacterized protein OS=Planctomyces brasiliensis (strain ATCC 49424 / DSM 5305 / JCM 21570 / NBRC 103401 / IFAM 1448) GN=Plabr_3771 PE=4 SV=1 [Gemmataceae bacterium]VTT98292.1 Uncharacterized protein OS=Planctomyces brasiliensis (strain ATCC 49424 / DSM 5305 / JCM 21570 / NBRC 103401 / IFAM 1448) GN=Plabr_3771 PE=4 SV=1 [Gemmataceae bacterium]
MTPPNDPFPPPEPGLDALVREQLDAEAGRVDAGRMWDRLAGQLRADAAPVTPPPRNWARVAAGFATAAALLVAAFVLAPTRDAAATPAQVVESARAAYRPDADRSYTQTVQLPPNLPAPMSLLFDSGRAVTVRTRGDRFVVTPGLGGRGAWGRDANGRVWIAPTRDAAARFTAAELPPPVQDAVKIRALEVGPLLDEVLKDFDLAWAEPPARGAPTLAVRATRRGETFAGQIHSAELVVEKDTRVVRSLVLRRPLAVGGLLTLTFTLADTTERDPADYSAEGHVGPGQPVYDASRPVLRRRVLLQNLGDVIVNGL